MAEPRVVMEQDTHRDLKALAGKRGMSIQALLERIVSAYLKRFRSEP